MHETNYSNTKTIWKLFNGICLEPNGLIADAMSSSLFEITNYSNQRK